MAARPRDTRFHWTQQSPTQWSADVGHALTGRVDLGPQYYGVTSTDGSLHGDHGSLDSAMAQVEAWARWSDAQR